MKNVSGVYKLGDLEHEDHGDQKALEQSLITHNHLDLLRRIKKHKQLRFGKPHHELLRERRFISSAKNWRRTWVVFRGFNLVDGIAARHLCGA